MRTSVMIFCCLSAGFRPDVYPTCTARTNMRFYETLFPLPSLHAVFNCLFKSPRADEGS